MLWRLYGTPCSISDCIGYLSPIHNPVLTVFLIIQKKIPPPCHNICTYLCFSNEKVKCYERVGKVQNAYLRHHRGDWSLLLRRQKRGKKTKNKKKNISEWSGEQFKEKTLYLEEDTTVQMKADTDLEGQAHSKGRFIHRAVILKHKHASSCTPPTPSAAVPFGWRRVDRLRESEQMLRGPGSTLMLRFWSLVPRKGAEGHKFACHTSLTCTITWLERAGAKTPLLCLTSLNLTTSISFTNTL